MAPEFTRKNKADDSAKLESLCMSCSQKLSAYTLEGLSKKELGHRCRPKREPRERSPRNSSKQMLY